MHCQSVAAICFLRGIERSISWLPVYSPQQFWVVNSMDWPKLKTSHSFGFFDQIDCVAVAKTAVHFVI